MQKLSRSTLTLMLILCIMVVAACSQKTPEEIFITAQNSLNSLESYAATIIYRVIDGQEKREYRFKQWVTMPSCFKIQILDEENGIGKTIVSDGHRMVIENPKIGDSLEFELESLEQQRPLFIGDFLRLFWMAEEVEKKIHIDEGVEYVIFTCSFSNADLSRGSQELWLRSPKMVPTRMITYDENNEITSIILFQDFDRSWKPDQDFYKTGDFEV